MCKEKFSLPYPLAGGIDPMLVVLLKRNELESREVLVSLERIRPEGVLNQFGVGFLAEGYLGEGTPSLQFGGSTLLMEQQLAHFLPVPGCTLRTMGDFHT